MKLRASQALQPILYLAHAECDFREHGNISGRNIKKSKAEGELSKRDSPHAGKEEPNQAILMSTVDMLDSVLQHEMAALRALLCDGSSRPRPATSKAASAVPAC